MATEKVSQRVAALRSVSNKDQTEVLILLNALIDGVRALTVKLDAEAAGGVTGFDTDYTAAFDALITKS